MKKLKKKKAEKSIREVFFPTTTFVVIDSFIWDISFGPSRSRKTERGGRSKNSEDDEAK